MSWIILSLVYAVTNAFYTSYNEKRAINGYILGIWRGFGISALTAPLLLTVPLIKSPEYYLILILQGIMIGIYDSHVFFASAKYGSRASSGFMATCVLITAFLWWGIDFTELAELMQNPSKLISLAFILCGFSVCYWQMMRVHISRQAEKYLYPAVFALSLMSIATRYIALNGGSPYAGVVYYLTVACFISGIYNTIMLYFRQTPAPQHPLPNQPEKTHTAQPFSPLWLIGFSTVLITAKTLALRMADNPAYVIAMLLLSPMISEIIDRKQIKISLPALGVIIFLGLLLGLTG